MPSEGGNPRLSDQDIIDVISYVRGFQFTLPQFAESEAEENDAAGDAELEQAPELEDSVVQPAPAPESEQAELETPEIQPVA